MVLHIVNVPDEAPGADWSHTVPGKYLYDVTGVTAVLNASAALQMVDATGNGNDGHYTAGGGSVLADWLGQPGAFVDNAAVQMLNAGDPAGFLQATRVGATTMVWNGDITIEFWARIDATGNPVLIYDSANGTTGATVGIALDGGILLTLGNGEGYESVAIPAMFDGAWHYCAVALPFASNVSFTFDATNPAILSQVLPGLRFHQPTTDSGYSSPNGGPNVDTWWDEVAVYPVALSVLQRQAHFSASALGFAVYSGAVLADAPAMYFHLADQGGPGGRQVALEITDGTQTIELVPSGFAIDPAVGTTTYSWQPRLQARARSSDGTLLTVPTPELHLPAGYTLGTFTPDLGPDDQWTGIIIWWDDAYQTAQQAADSYLYAPGAHLVYQQVKAG